MKIQFLGAAGDVTGSQYLLEINGGMLLLDCGLYQGEYEESFKRNRSFRFKPKKLDAVILSHAHIDHSGNLPNLVKRGFHGPIYMTEATAELADIMLRDSGHIQESDAEDRNRINRKSGMPVIEAMYSVKDAKKAIGQFKRMEYDHLFTPINGVNARLVEAGHILGSASVCLDIAEEGRPPYRFWFSGDIGRKDLALIRDPELPERVDYLLMEATYGDTRHAADPETAMQKLGEIVIRTIERGGTVVIPAFAVGRTQDVVYGLNQLMQSDGVKPFPVFVDSPLAVEASRAYHTQTEYYDEETHEFIEEEGTPPLQFKGLRYIRAVNDSRELVRRDDPKVVISASGMADAGRVVHHIVDVIEDPQSTILIVSWQAPGTLGSRLLETKQGDTIEIRGETYRLAAEIAQIDGLSAHAGQNTLLEYALASRDTLKKVIVVHSEPQTAATFAERLREAGIPDVLVPDLYETVEI